MHRPTLLSIVLFVIALCVSFNAQAQNCNTSGTCLQVYQSGSGIGLFAVAQSSTAISATSQTSSGLAAFSQTGNAILGSNSRTDWNAAVVTAIAGNDNGLAYWGTGGIEITGNAAKPAGGMWSGTSDVRVKKDVKDFHLGLPELTRIRPVSYKYNGLGGTVDDGKEHVGVIAQEVEQILPAMVSSRKMKLRSGDAHESDILQVDPSDFTYVLINAVKEQQQIIERQDARIARLERGRPSLLSYVGPNGIGVAALALVPLGLFAGRRRRLEQDI